MPPCPLLSGPGSGRGTPGHPEGPESEGEGVSLAPVRTPFWARGQLRCGDLVNSGIVVEVGAPLRVGLSG